MFLKNNRPVQARTMQLLSRLFLDKR